MASSAAAPSPNEAVPPAPAPTREVGTTTQNEPSRTGFDPRTGFWLNYFKHLTGQMTAEGSFHFREDVYRQREAADCARCERDRDWLLRYSPTVRFLSERIAALDGKLDATNIRCQRCPTLLGADGTVHRRGGGFNPHIGVLICANEMRDRKHLEDTLSHEMVHAWDHLRWKVDFDGAKDLRQAACTEVRTQEHEHKQESGGGALAGVILPCGSAYLREIVLISVPHRYERPC